MQHAVNEAFAQCPARESHALNIELAENGNQNRQAARKDERAFKRQAFNFELFQTSALNRALFELL